MMLSPPQNLSPTQNEPEHVNTGDQASDFLAPEFDILNDLRFMLDRNEIKDKLYEFIVLTGFDIASPINKLDHNLLVWAVSNGTTVEFLDVVLEIYRCRGLTVEEVFENNISLLGFAVKNGLEKKAQLLCYYGADPNYTIENGITCVPPYDSNELNIQPKSLEQINEFQNKLADAINFGNVRAVVDEFINTNAISKPIDDEKNTLLHKAIHIGVIKPDLNYILKSYLKENLIDIKNAMEETPLMFAVIYQDISATKLLLKNKANPNSQDKLNKSILQFAFEGKSDAIFSLIYQQADKKSHTNEMIARYEKIIALKKPVPRVNPLQELPNNNIQKLSEFCKEYNADGITLKPCVPTIDNAIDKKQASYWVESHPPKFQPLAKKIIDNIQYTNFPSFLEQLKKSVTSFNDKIASSHNTKYILVLPDENNKSNPWVFSHALPFLEILPSYVVREDELAGLFRESQDKNFNLLFVDDAAYSGTQTKASIDYCSSVATRHDKDINIFCIIPFMTKRAHELLNRHNEVFISHHIEIPSIKKLFTPDEQQLLQENNVNSTNPIETIYLNWPELTLAYFQHKIADWKSTFVGILKEGRTIHDINRKIQFIPLTIEPYKKDISIPREMLLSYAKDNSKLSDIKNNDSNKNEKPRSSFFNPTSFLLSALISAGTFVGGLGLSATLMAFAGAFCISSATQFVRSRLAASSFLEFKPSLIQTGTDYIIKDNGSKSQIDYFELGKKAENNWDAYIYSACYQTYLPTKHSRAFQAGRKAQEIINEENSQTTKRSFLF
ncbi:MAG: ankyrin repeat domain-containing protein [Proteobacteria bacterium]|nr:ankyrin repeat domain-containing protein [Pseudomonadota bacterium]